MLSFVIRFSRAKSNEFFPSHHRAEHMHAHARVGQVQVEAHIRHTILECWTR